MSAIVSNPNLTLLITKRARMISTRPAEGPELSALESRIDAEYDCALDRLVAEHPDVVVAVLGTVLTDPAVRRRLTGALRTLDGIPRIHRGEPLSPTRKAVLDAFPAPGVRIDSGSIAQKIYGSDTPTTRLRVRHHIDYLVALGALSRVSSGVFTRVLASAGARGGT